jgi:hypothetical protein
MEPLNDLVQDIVQSIGYTVTENTDEVIVAKKKKTLKLFILEDWSFENFEKGLQKLAEIKGEDDYCAVVEPSAELGRKKYLHPG